MDRAEWLRFPCVTLMDREEMGQVMIEAPRSSEVTTSQSQNFAFLNVIVDNGNSDPEDLWLFANDDGTNDQEVMVISSVIDIFDLLLLLRAFPSKSQARKNWKGGGILDGWSEFRVGKFKHHLCIWNPQEPR